MVLRRRSTQAAAVGDLFLMVVRCPLPLTLVLRLLVDRLKLWVTSLGLALSRGSRSTCDVSCRPGLIWWSITPWASHRSDAKQAGPSLRNFLWMEPLFIDSSYYAVETRGTRMAPMGSKVRPKMETWSSTWKSNKVFLGRMGCWGLQAHFDAAQLKRGSAQNGNLMLCRHRRVGMLAVVLSCLVVSWNTAYRDRSSRRELVELWSSSSVCRYCCTFGCRRAGG